MLLIQQSIANNICETNCRFLQFGERQGVHNVKFRMSGGHQTIVQMLEPCAGILVIPNLNDRNAKVTIILQGICSGDDQLLEAFIIVWSAIGDHQDDRRLEFIHSANGVSYNGYHVSAAFGLVHREPEQTHDISCCPHVLVLVEWPPATRAIFAAEEVQGNAVRIVTTRMLG